MEVRNIVIKIKSPDDKHALGIWTTSFDAGRIGDTGVTRLIFDRPDAYVTSNLRLVFQAGYKDPIMVDLGQSNTFMLTSAQTQYSEFKLQVVFTEANTGIEVKSNKLTFYLTSSITSAKTCNVDWVQELLQFALSEKVSMTRIVPEYPSTPTTQDNENEEIPVPTYYLKGFNHFGDLIFNIEIPFKEAYDYLNQNGEIDPPEPTDSIASNVKYDNTLVNPDESESLPPRLAATQVQSALDELITNLFDLKNSIPDDVTQVMSDIQSINKSIANINDQISSINATDQVQSQNINTTQEGLSKTNTKVSELTTSINTLSGTVGQQSDTLRSQGETISAQGTQLNKVRQDLDNLTEEESELTTFVENLDNKVTDLKNNPYKLPPATSTTLGGIKVGANLTVDADGTLNALGGDEPVPSYVLPPATTDTLGGIKVGDNLSIDPDGKLNANQYNLPVASSTQLGGIKLGEGLQVDANGVVKVVYVYVLPTASSTTLGGIKIGSGLSIADDGTVSAQGGGSEFVLPIASSSVLGGVKIGSNMLIDENGVLTANLGDITNQLSSLSTQLTNTSTSLGNLSNEVSTLETQQSTNTTNISSLSEQLSSLQTTVSQLQSSLNSKLSSSGGTMTGALVAGGTQAENVQQVRNIVIYPKGTDVSTINVPDGTVVMIKEE